MTEENEHEYKFFTKEDVESFEPRPIRGTIEECLRDALTDIIHLSETEGMTEEQVDNVLRGIIDKRAERVRGRFILHTEQEE
jgi:hypothetical protein